MKKKDKFKLKDFVKILLNNWPEISDHMDKKFLFKKKNNFGNGFYVDYFFNDKVLNFSNNYQRSN